MKTRYQYIFFTEVIALKKRKTQVWRCFNVHSYGILGTVKWYAHWRQYCFFPEMGTVFNRECMVNINSFITQLMKARKG